MLIAPPMAPRERRLAARTLLLFSNHDHQKQQTENPDPDNGEQAVIATEISRGDDDGERHSARDARPPLASRDGSAHAHRHSRPGQLSHGWIAVVA